MKPLAIVSRFLVLAFVLLAGLSGLAQAPTTFERKAQAPPKATLTTVVNLNTAGKPELLTLPGIGETKADRILAYRTAHGPFTSVDDILAVRGIGRKTLDAMRARLTVTAPKR